MIARIILLAAALALAGCATDGGPKSSVAGSCAVFERPAYALRGATQYDQDVADKYVESGVAGCHWARPAPRPAELDRQPPPKAAIAAPAPHRGFLARVRHKVAGVAARVRRHPQPPPVPVQATFPDQPVAPVTAAPDAPEPPPAPPPPRSRTEQLLRPNG